MSSLNIAIIGAGMGGLAAACLLFDLGHTITVFDQFDTPRPVGSGLVIQPIGMRVLDRIGAGDIARTHGNALNRMIGHEADRGKCVLHVSYGKRNGLAIHRSALFDALLYACHNRGISITARHCATRVIEGRIDFETGQIEGPFDLVIDASGARSRISPLKAHTLPYGAIWGTVDWPSNTTLPFSDLTQRYRRADRMVGVLPMGTLPNDPVPKAAIFWSLPKDHHAAWQDAGITAWHREAIALWPEFAPFAEQITAPDQMTMARYAHGTLRRPFSDRLVHIGDAAHRASPQLGQGANMALLDAWALAQALKHFPRDKALPAYARARRAHVWAYQLISAAFTPQYQSDSRWLPILRDRFFFPVSRIPPVPRLLTALVCGTILPPLGYLSEISSS